MGGRGGGPKRVGSKKKRIVTRRPPGEGVRIDSAGGAGCQREMTMAADARKEVSESGPRRQSGGVVRAQDSVRGPNSSSARALGITELSFLSLVRRFC